MKPNILVITCWCGGQNYAGMTQAMLFDLVDSLEAADCTYTIAMTQQGVPEGTKFVPPVGAAVHVSERNIGFAYGMNQALELGIHRQVEVGGRSFDAVLCLNNDILMPNKDWLAILLDELQDDAIGCPTTNYCSVNEQRATGPVDKDPIFHGVTPAICWLIPMAIVATVTEYLGGKFFPEDLGGRAWGEDNYTAGLVRNKVRADPFKIVPRSWINHLGAKTSSVIPAEEKMRAHGEAQRRMKRDFG